MALYAPAFAVDAIITEFAVVAAPGISLIVRFSAKGAMI
jgi:hypothetical protein